MTREQAKDYIKGQLESYLQGKGINTHKNFKCFICDGGNKTPNMGYKNDRVHCFACGADMDIIDLIGHETGKSGAELFNYCYDYFRITIDGNQLGPPYAPPSKNTKQETHSADYHNFFLQARKTLHDNTEALTYLQDRGISVVTADRFMLGYCPEWKHPKRQYDEPTKRIIIPTSKQSYLARAIGAVETPKSKVGNVEHFNLKALYGTVPVFITEAEIDAISIEEVGGTACALGASSMVKKFLETCKKEPPTVPLILSLDNDVAGKEAQDKLKNGLETLNIAYVEVNTAGEHKDPNEALTANRDLFFKAVRDANTQAIQHAQEAEATREAEREAEREQYINATSVTANINDFLGEIKNSVNTPAIPTNFPELDKVLDDGLYEGLYILGAISSLGKTSFILQIADQIAQQGQDVLIFSLEMAKTELMAKSISRITFLECGGKTNYAKTTRGITSGKRHTNYSGEEKTLINKSINLYATYTDYLYIQEGMGNIGAAQIRGTAERHIKVTGHKPVIVIDYLQILAPFDIRATDKQNTDKSIFELKRLSRDLKIPVIGISSLNRENYNANINMAAFKESGAIEYSSDVLIGLQFEAMNEDNVKTTAESINRFKRKEPRKIELKILKNRNGMTGDAITYDYYPKFNFFKETGKKNNDDSREPGGSARGNNKR